MLTHTRTELVTTYKSVDYDTHENVDIWCYTPEQMHDSSCVDDDDDEHIHSNTSVGDARDTQTDHLLTNESVDVGDNIIGHVDKSSDFDDGDRRWG